MTFGTENLSVVHEETCDQKGELCLCIKKELTQLFKILNNYQDQVIDLEAKIIELKKKK